MDLFVGGTGNLSEPSENLEIASGGRGNLGESCGPLRAPAFHWYALHTYPRHEKRVHEDLGRRAIESFLPLYETARRWKNGCKMKIHLPLFPGYLFLRIDPRERFKALNLPGAVSIVGSAKGPWPLPDTEITNLREKLRLRPFEPHPYLAIGQVVRIKSGPLADLTGYLVRQPGSCRVVISIELIHGAAAVEVDQDDVEPIDRASVKFDA